MTFTTLTFLFAFLPLSLLIYRAAAKTRWANLTLLVLSFLFYGWGSLRQLFVLIMLLLFNWAGCMMISRQKGAGRRISMLACVGFDLFVLFYYRYLGVWFSSVDQWLPLQLSALPLLMPVGLSFYLFSCLSAVFDVYRNQEEPIASFVDFGVYAAFFGRVNMGPIASFSQMKPQLKNHPSTRSKTAYGMALFVQGLFSKVVIADSLASVYAALSGNTTWLGNLLFGFLYFFQLFFDFMGYSRMARGLGWMVGFDIPENFNLPYTALSVQDFWRRWHISLTDWFRRYVYIPLGGNRVSTQRWVLNLMTVWLLTGLWHGAVWTFLIWGLYQGLMIVLERFWLNKILGGLPSWIRHAYLIVTQLIGWTFFSSESIGQAFMQIIRYIGIGASGFWDSSALFYLRTSLVLFAAAVVISSGFSRRLAEMIRRVSKESWWIWQSLGYLGMFVLSVIFLVSQSSQTFLYAVF